MTTSSAASLTSSRFSTRPRRGGGDQSILLKPLRTIVSTLPCRLTGAVVPFAAGCLFFWIASSSIRPSPTSTSSSSFSLLCSHPSSSLALQPRAMKPGATCSPSLECAWSLDTPRTQHPSMRLYYKSRQQEYVAKSKWDDPHYNEMSTWYEQADPRFLQSTGIVHFGGTLPEHIHVIPIAGESYFRRSLRDADMIMDGFLRASSFNEPKVGEEWLDFGGSHGRVAQIMAAAYPDVSWHVCDPIVETVQWAQERLPRLHFKVMGQKPPLPYGDEAFAGIYALSIWSHYSEEAALVWFDEMWRILKPGGVLWFSTHGYQALNFAMLDKAIMHPSDRREAMFRDLYLKGHFYFPMFGSQGDWGVSDGTSDGSWWGYGAFTAEWLAARLLNSNAKRKWRLEYYGPGVNERHQDVYVLSKVS